METVKRGAVLWAVAGVLLLAWLIFATAANAGAEDRVSEEIALQEKEERFYRVVAGDLPGSETNQLNKLAKDLRDLEAEDLATFSGDSNRYGGIEDELGFDPFDGQGCNECGHLDQEVIANVEIIKNGGLDEVVTQLENEVDDPTTISEPPGFLWILWWLSLPLGVGFLYVRDRRNVEARYREFSQERRLLGELQEVRGELSERDRVTIDALADRLQAQIDTRVNYSKSKEQQMRLERLVEEATDALEAIAAGNQTLDTKGRL